MFEDNLFPAKELYSKIGVSKKLKLDVDQDDAFDY